MGIRRLEETARGFKIQLLRDHRIITLEELTAKYLLIQVTTLLVVRLGVSPHPVQGAQLHYGPCSSGNLLKRVLCIIYTVQLQLNPSYVQASLSHHGQGVGRPYEKRRDEAPLSLHWGSIQ